MGKNPRLLIMNTNKQVENVLNKLQSARKLEKDYLEKGLDCVDEHVKNVDDNWLWFEEDREGV